MNEEMLEKKVLVSMILFKRNVPINEAKIIGALIEKLEQQCKKQKEVIDNINLIIKGIAYGGSEDYYMEDFSKINELLKEVS